MPFKNNNNEAGLPKNNLYQVGVTDVDANLLIEQNIGLPISSTPEASWVYFDCSVGVMLDSGIVVHNRLPQINNTYDSLATEGFGSAAFDKLTNGVNLKSNDQYQDIVQRMGHSRYWFRVWGRALRIGKQIPIPGLKFIGGVPAIPYDKNPQWAYNSIVPGGNYGGTILWRAEWSLWYTTAIPPFNNVIPAADASGHINANVVQPTATQSPYSQADDNAVAFVPGVISVAEVLASSSAAAARVRGGQ